MMLSRADSFSMSISHFHEVIVAARLGPKSCWYLYIIVVIYQLLKAINLIISTDTTNDE